MDIDTPHEQFDLIRQGKTVVRPLMITTLKDFGTTDEKYIKDALLPTVPQLNALDASDRPLIYAPSVCWISSCSRKVLAKKELRLQI